MVEKISLEHKCNFLKPYRKPLLEDLGDLRDITLGGSPGSGESGSTIHNPLPHQSSGGSSVKGGSNLPNLLDLQTTQQTKKKR